jgi:membrane associated rhomboid family serine protease
MENLPLASSGQWQALRPYSKKIIIGKAAVEKAISRWNQPFYPLIIARPGSLRFMPVLCLDEYRTAVHNKLMHMQRIGIYIFLGLVLGITVAGYLRERPQTLNIALLTFSIVIFWTLDYRLVIRNLDALTERVLFYYSVQHYGRFDVVAWTGAMLLAACVQLYGQSLFGGLDPLLERFGGMYVSVRQGQLWRLLVGPWFHTSIPHWFANLAMLIFVAPIVGAISRRCGIAVFFTGSVLGALVSMLFSKYNHFEVYTGVSAGILAMLGFCCGAALKKPHHFPAKFAHTFITFGIFSIFISYLIAPNSANSSHIVGLLSGMIFGLVFFNRLKLPTPQRRLRSLTSDIKKRCLKC